MSQLDTLNGLDVIRRAPKLDSILACIGAPLRRFHVEVGKGPRVEGERYILRLSNFKLHSRKALQLP